MRRVAKTVYFHRDKDDNFDLEEELKEMNFNTENVLYLGYEIEMEVMLSEDGTNKVLKIQGKDVSELSISI